MACRREPSATRGTRCAVATHPLRPAPRHRYVSRTEVTGTERGPSRKGALAQRQLRRHAADDGSSAEGQPSLEDPRADAGHYSQNADAGRSTLDAEDPVRDVLRNPFCRLEVYVVRGVRGGRDENHSGTDSSRAFDLSAVALAGGCMVGDPGGAVVRNRS